MTRGARLAVAGGVALVALGTVWATRRDVPRAPAPWLSLSGTRALRASVDTSRTRRTLEGSDVWLRFDYGAPRTAADAPAREYTRQDAHLLVDCPGHRARTLETIRRDAAGTVVVDRSHTGREGGGWMPFDMHDLGEQLLMPLCEALQRYPGRPAG